MNTNGSVAKKMQEVNCPSFRLIRKRDGRIASFDSTKITEAIFKAALSVGGSDRKTAEHLTEDVLNELASRYPSSDFGVEDVQDIVEKVLIEKGHARTAKAYILYRDKRNKQRSALSNLMDSIGTSLKETDRENANIGNCFSAKLLKVAEVAAREYYLSRVIPEPMANAHIQGDCHIHDLAHYATTLNCEQIPLGKLLSTGFNNGHGYIRPPKRPSSATALAAILLQSAQNDLFGGQSIGFFDRDMAPYVAGYPDAEVFQAMEALVYNLNSMHSRAGAQVPFSSLNLGTDTSEGGRLATKNLLLAYEKGLGRGETPIFPNVIFRVKEGVNLNPGDPNYDLFRLAIRVASTRMNPTFSFMDSSFNKGFAEDVGYMGCRTRVISNINGEEVTEGRGNLSFTTINLPRLAIKANGNITKFFIELTKMLELVGDQLIHRYRAQAQLKVRDLPLVMGQKLYKGSEELGPEDSIEPAMKHGSLSIGFIGLAETLTALIGTHHGQSGDANRLGHEILGYMRAITDLFTTRYKLNFSLLATPAEGLSGRFVKMDKELFGVIPGVTDQEYYTNSFHVPVHCEIDAIDKIDIEGAYHKYCNAGHISYIELSAPPIHNPDAVEALIRHMRNADIGYAGINFPIDFCNDCGLTGVIDEDRCPQCYSSDIRRVRRITGYLSTVDRFNSAKQNELKNRQKHL